jgi:hypothetical protein
MKSPLEVIPGVGKSVAKDLQDLGYSTVADLKNEDPEIMYDRLNTLRGVTIDRCMLYTFRCAVYFASHESHDTKLLKWWNWKDVTP